MAQFSTPWTCVPVGDGGVNSLTLEGLETMNAVTSNVRPRTDGVVYWTDTFPLPLPAFNFPSGGTNPLNFFLNATLAGSTITIRPGVGMVRGWLYASDANVAFNGAGGNANAIDIIGLRRSLIGQTVRLFLGRGAAGNKYVLTQDTTNWEVPLWEIPLSGAGTPTGLVDVREFVKTPLNPPQKWTMVSPVMGGANNVAGSFVPLSTQTANPYGLGNELGLSLIDGTDRLAFYLINVPPNALGGQIDIQAIVWSSVQPPVGNVVYRYEVYNANNRPVGTDFGTNFTIPASQTGDAFPTWSEIQGSNLLVTAGNQYVVKLHRAATAPGDTYTGAMMTNGLRVFANVMYAPGGHYRGLPIG